MSTDNNKENKDEIVKANIIALPKNSSSLVRRAIQDIDVFIANPYLLVKPVTKINPIDGAEMVWVPGGTFTMGSPDGVENDAHQVTLSGYWIYKYEVTVAQYLAFCEATSRKLPKFPKGYSWEGKLGWYDSALQQHPIVNVSWFDCMAYSDWAGINLPTEVQWEYTARGPQGNNYPWGGSATASDSKNGWDQNKCANYINSFKVGKSTWSVGSFPAGASWCGAQDMAGNVWEWCVYWYDEYYMTTPTNNPTGSETGVLRGGSWYVNYDDLRGACSVDYDPDNSDNDTGFRCASKEINILTTDTQIESNQEIVQIKQTEQTLVKPFPTTKINPIDGAEMVWVPSGTFTMGSPDGVGFRNEHPAHQVTLSGYWMYKYEVTVAQYRAFCTATKRTLPDFPPGYSWTDKSGWIDPAIQQYPIVYITWDDCKAYADWAKTSLPTEAQWEYAARGPQELNYPWGGIAISDDWYNNGWDETKCANLENSYSQNISTWPVGSFPTGASWCGAQDLAGNVWEWCADWYGDDYYKTATVKNPTGPKTGKRHVLRGGSWYEGYYGGDGVYYYGNSSHRGSCRGGASPYLDYCVGFRCALPEIDVLTTNQQISESNDNIVQIKETKQMLIAAPLPITKINPIRQITRSLQELYKSILKSQQTTKINPVDGAEMVWVSGGTFTMGSAEGIRHDVEHHVHQVTLSGYWMYKYPVTVAQYSAFYTVIGHKLPEFPEGYSWDGKSGWNDPELQRHPIVMVTWDDCKAYADWAGVNLPTEAQWEYAARGTEGRNYPWGGIATSDDWSNGWDKSKCANLKNSYSQNISTWPVGSFPVGASWCGVHDLAGNVCEWCADWYGADYYKNAPVRNPTGPVTGEYRVRRSHSWNLGVNYTLRGVFRGYNYPNYFDNEIGFRCISLQP